MRLVRTTAALATIALATTALTACGGGDDAASTAGGGSRPTLTVLAAASLTEALTACTRDYPDAKVRLSFGGSDELAAQLRRGVPADLYAAANAKLPQQLADEGTVTTPVPYARNEVVLAVPAQDARVTSLADLAADSSARLAIGSPTVPIGSATRSLLGRLPAAEEQAILDRVKTEEPDVKSVLAKLQRGVVDAAFVYRTDVQATGGAVRAIALPAETEPTVTYEGAVVRAGKHADAATALLEDLRGGDCQQALQTAGFLPPEER
jgi:molybdate transport system substrate-binding protein